ncbi:MAG TPA: DUF3006 domain-containing protein [Firmicutes bacterium]|nr:DUF3006 domain-containing protein [Bacillota bacterium]
MLVIDRLEGEWAVLEWEGRTFRVPRDFLPEEVKEGDCLRWQLEVDASATEARRIKIRALLRRLES